MTSSFGFSLLILLVLSDTAAAAGKRLILEDTSKRSGPSTYTFRGYNLYAQAANTVAMSILCKLPGWYNETAMGKANVKWATGDSGSTLNIPATQATTTFECSVENSDGKALEGWEKTKLHYRKASGVNFATPARSVILYNDTGVVEPLELHCTPPEKLKWYLDGKEVTDANKNVKIEEGNGSLVLQRPSFRDVGVYMCKQDDTKFAYYSIEGAPFFVNVHRKNYDSDNKLEGETVTILHELYGNPLPPLIWKRQSDEDAGVETLTDEFFKSHPDFTSRLKFYPTMNVTNGEFELSNLNKDDRAYYYSYAENEYGNSDFKTLVRVKGKLDALWPFLGIVAEVVILVAIILIYERRRMKQDREADEATDQKKPLTSTNSDNVRQRKT